MKHPVQILAIALVLVVIAWVAIKYPQVVAPIAACCVLAVSMLVLSCAFSGRRRNIDDPEQ